MSDELLPRILPNRKIKRAAVRFLWYTASFQLPCRPAASRSPGPSRRPIRSWIGGALSSVMLMGRRSPMYTSRMGATANHGKA
jgi:hypothetical protein